MNNDAYFTKFPIFSYSNTLCVDITKRVVIANTIQQDLFAYYPYEMKSHQRADTIADRYYGDSYYSWLVYLSNGIVDPYYSFPMQDQVFQNYINVKYGGLANASQLILWWQNNWYADTDTRLPVDFYNNTLTEGAKKYYEAVYGEQTRIMYYQRRRVDWRASTNMVVYFNIANTSGSFQNDEVVNLILPPGNTVISNSYVTFSNTSQVTVQHVLGNIQANSTTQYLIGTVSGTTANVTQTTVIANNISLAEGAFWSPVYAYDYEVGLNQQRKFKRLIDAKYAMTISETLRKDLLP